MKRIFCFIIITAFSVQALYGSGKITAGGYAGYHYDPLNLSARRNINADVQQNISAGAIIKIDIDFLFIRSGADYSYPVSDGRIDDAGRVTGTEVSFVEVPVYGGLNLPVRDYGSFYMGGGGSYIFAFGNISTLSGREDVNEQLFGWGFVAGMEADVAPDISLFAEWEYMTAGTSPVASSSGGPDDFCLDFTGSRYRFGVLYHINRY